MKVLVCGGREFHNYEVVREVLCDTLLCADSPVVIHGGARGADALAERWCQEHKVHSAVVKPDWDYYGKMAGILRNEAMLALGPDLVIAFRGGKGTAHMVKIAKKAGIPVKEVKS
ncbi:MAG: SLOG family protein [Pyrinomonadaceae bacterium]